MIIINIVPNPVNWVRNKLILDNSTTSLREGDLKSRESAAAILGKLGGNKAELALANALKDSLSVRKIAINSLKRMGVGNRLIKRSISMLKQGELLERETAAWALGEIEEQQEKIIYPLLESLYDDFRLVRKTAASSLVKIGKPALQSVVTHLADNANQLTGDKLLVLLKVIRELEPEKEQLSRLEPFLLSILLTGNVRQEILLETKQLLRYIQ